MMKFLVLMLVVCSGGFVVAKEKPLDLSIQIAFINVPASKEAKTPLDPRELKLVKGEVSRIFSRVGVAVVYGEATDPNSLIVEFVSKRILHCKQKQKNNYPMGCAIIDQDTNKPVVAFVDTDLLKMIDLKSGVTQSWKLVARVVVHEVVHLQGGLVHVAEEDGTILSHHYYWSESSLSTDMTRQEVEYIRLVVSRRKSS